MKSWNWFWRWPTLKIILHHQGRWRGLLCLWIMCLIDTITYPPSLLCRFHFSTGMVCEHCLQSSIPPVYRLTNGNYDMLKRNFKISKWIFILQQGIETGMKDLVLLVMIRWLDGGRSLWIIIISNETLCCWKFDYW